MVALLWILVLVMSVVGIHVRVIVRGLSRHLVAHDGVIDHARSDGRDDNPVNASDCDSNVRVVDCDDSNHDRDHGYHDVSDSSRGRDHDHAIDCVVDNSRDPDLDPGDRARDDNHAVVVSVNDNVRANVNDDDHHRQTDYVDSRDLRDQARRTLAKRE